MAVLHIVEKNIDYNYDWNEWALRRKAIQVGPKTCVLLTKAMLCAQRDDSLSGSIICIDLCGMIKILCQLTNLRYKKTHSAQTDLSHFR